MHDYPAIMSAILDGYALPVCGDHGVVHWARVLENGIRLTQRAGGDVEVVRLFSLFHDSRRINEYYDDGHGLRGGEFAHSLRGSLVHLDDARFELLFEACRLHTDGYTNADVTLQVCWDADRLDLGRVGITPRPQRLCTDAARELLDWSHDRSVSGFVPKEIAVAWGVPEVLS